MQIRRIIGGNLEENTYILYNKTGGDCLIIDPGYNANKIAEEINSKNLNPTAIVLTHHHYDHVGAVVKFKKIFDIPVMIHRIDSFMVDFNCDRLLENGDLIPLENDELEVIHTPGHTAGSICLISHKSKIVITGDTLFDTDLGRTDLEDGSEEDMKNSIKNILANIPNEYMIYPGHDGSCNMKYVRTYNKEFLSCI